MNAYLNVNTTGFADPLLIAEKVHYYFSVCFDYFLCMKQELQERRLSLTIHHFLTDNTFEDWRRIVLTAEHELSNFHVGRT
jgi:hypothetical protein